VWRLQVIDPTSCHMQVCGSRPRPFVCPWGGGLGEGMSEPGGRLRRPSRLEIIVFGAFKSHLSEKLRSRRAFGVLRSLADDTNEGEHAKNLQWLEACARKPKVDHDPPAKYPKVR